MDSGAFACIQCRRVHPAGAEREGADEMQRNIRTVFMRGGTSRALFFREEDLPADPEVRAQVILAAYGSPDPYGRQIDGIGGATSTTSKVAIISRGSRPGVDVDYTFGQVDITRPLIDMRGNCGNISGAVGPYALDEGYATPTDPITDITFLNTNTNKVIVAHVPTREGRFDEEGDYAIDGIPGTASKIVLDYLDPGGAVTGKLLPTGNVRDTLDVPGLGQIEVSIVDAANPLVFTRFQDFGLTGEEQPDDIDSNPELLKRIEAVRAAAGIAIGLGASAEEMTQKVPSVPKLAFVAPPKPYRKISGDVQPGEAIDLLAKIMSMGKMHRAYALTGAICTTIAAAVPDSLVNEVLSPAGRETGRVRLGHPSGIIDMSGRVTREGGEWRADKVSSTRTARRLMEGHVLVPERLFGPTR
jgi:2-methylaconitate cis-trans-isomerase PrpF